MRKLFGAFCLLVFLAACDEQGELATPKAARATTAPVMGQIQGGILATPTPTPTASASAPTPTPTPTLAPLPDQPVQAQTPAPPVNSPVVATQSI